MNGSKARSDDAASVKHAGPLAVAGKFAAALGRSTLCNLAQWCRVLTRTPRAQTPPLPAATIPAILVTLAVVAASMFLVDARATDWASHRPSWLTGAFEQITDFGESGWFLVPCGCIVLCLAALTSAALPRLTQGVLAALAARFGFVFLAIAAPGLFVSVVKRLIGRARPFVGGHIDPFAYMFFVWRPAYASMPSGHATNVTAAAVAIGAIWPRTRAVMWIYALVIMFSRVAIFAHFTERRHCRRVGRHRRRGSGAPLFCSAASGVLAARSVGLSGPVARAHPDCTAPSGFPIAGTPKSLNFSPIEPDPDAL